jgi:hypothetical protein
LEDEDRDQHAYGGSKNTIISKSTFEATQVTERADATQVVADEFTAFKTGQNEFNTDVTSKLAALSTEDGRLDSDIQALNTDVNSKLSALSTHGRTSDSDIQALKVIEGRVDQQQTVTSDLTNKMNRLKFDDRNDTFCVCGTTVNSWHSFPEYRRYQESQRAVGQVRRSRVGGVPLHGWRVATLPELGDRGHVG